MKGYYIDEKLMDTVNGITYDRAKLTRCQKIKIYFGFMEEPPRTRIEPKLLCDIIPRVKISKGAFKR